MFTRDYRKILTILKELSLVTDSETWIKGIKSGMRAIQDLLDKYDGSSEGVF